MVVVVVDVAVVPAVDGVTAGCTRSEASSVHAAIRQRRARTMTQRRTPVRLRQPTVGVVVATIVWGISPELVLALEARLGPPVDSYLNGSQTWFTELPEPAPSREKAGGERAAVTLEWRLHPTAGYRLPEGMSHYELWDEVVGQLAATSDPSALALGQEDRALAQLWDGLECFPAYGDEVEPATLSAAATATLGLTPDAGGLVDHVRIGDAWERSRGKVSIVGLLFEQLSLGS